jgi:hypothetical protein
VRTIICDGTRAFVGSQSLRKLELDSRREVGIIAKDSKIVKKMVEVFETDWKLSAGDKKAEKKNEEAAVKDKVDAKDDKADKDKSDKDKADKDKKVAATA